MSKFAAHRPAQQVLSWWPSASRLAAVAAGLLLFAVSPLGWRLDQYAHGPYVTKQDSLYPLLRYGLDRIVEQEYMGVVLLLLALFFAFRHRALTPLLLYGAAQVLFGATAVLKLMLGKTYPAKGVPRYFAGGPDRADFTAMALPSGHATTAVILCGTILILLTLYTNVQSRRATRWYCVLWALTVAVALLTSLLLGFHWLSDLYVGVAWGALAFRLILNAYNGGALGWTAFELKKLFSAP